MAKFGRIRRSAAKVRAKARRSWALGRPGKKLKVTVYITRGMPHLKELYAASACSGPAGALRTQHKSCTKMMTGRTPQSAIGKALKSLGAKFSRRDAGKGRY